MTLNRTRQTDFLNVTQTNGLRIAVVGAGGIGSWTTLTLSKMGFDNITVFDDDIVEDHNLPSQCYSLVQIGKPKVDALQAVVKAMSGVIIQARNQRFALDDVFDVVLVCVDNMATRRQIADWFQAGDLSAKVVFDARMAIQELILVSYTHESVDRYLGALYTDNEAVQEPCTNKAIAFTTNLAAAMLGKAVAEYARDKSRFGAQITLDGKTPGGAMHYARK